MGDKQTALPYGVIGAGSFGTAVANLLAENGDVLLYSRRPEIVEHINTTHENLGVPLSPRIRAVDQLAIIAQQCQLIFPVVPSDSFRVMIKALSPHLRPYHFLIHGTKGLDISNLPSTIELTPRERISTMSEVILQESTVVRVGCLSGPNLATEIMSGQPAATVIASRFDEVVNAGRAALRSTRFQVYGNHDIIGAELAGALKNIMAIGSGILGGLGFGQNIWAVLVTRGLVEMLHLGRALGADTSAFFGIAGIGDLIATSSSKNSRNYRFGMRLASGETPTQILDSVEEVVEGIHTLEIAHKVSEYYKLHTPITNMLYKIIFENYDIHNAMNYLMSFPYSVDVDFL